jgi:hypothetical protein
MKMNDEQNKAENVPATDPPTPAEAEAERPKIRKITIKTAVRASGQSHNRFAGPTPD